MITYQDSSMISGRLGAAFAAVALMHMVAGSAFYLGLAQPIVRHFTPTATIDNILKAQKKFVLQMPEPKLNPLRRQYEEPQMVPVTEDSERQIVAEPTHPDPPVVVEPTPPAREAVAVVGARMDLKHPLHIGPDYYPSGAIRSGQEGRCEVQVAVAADGRITNSSLQTSSGFPLLDEACLSAVRGQYVLPARRDGKAIDSNASLPIVWKLTESR